MQSAKKLARYELVAPGFLQIPCAGYAIDAFGGRFTFSNSGEARGIFATQWWSQV